MPGSSKRNQGAQDKQRDKILEAAQTVFARKGPLTTMDDIAGEASVSHGLAFRYFDSKQALLRALVEQALAAPTAELERVHQTPGTAGERLARLVSDFVESRRRHPEVYQLVDQVLHSEATPEEFRELISKLSRAMQDLLRELIVEGQRTGEVGSDDADELVAALFASLDGLTRWAANHRDSTDDHFPGAVILLRMLKPDGYSERKAG